MVVILRNGDSGYHEAIDPNMSAAATEVLALTAAPEVIRFLSVGEGTYEAAISMRWVPITQLHLANVDDVKTKVSASSRRVGGSASLKQQISFSNVNFSSGEISCF